jgi:polysaccharide biosynthesis transport protein
MKNVNRLPPAHALDADPFAGTTESEQDSPLVIFQRLHRLLRGRYWLAFILAALGGAAGAVGGWMASEPKYQSVGSIRIVASLPVKLIPDSINQVPAMFQAYVKTQANYIQHPRVIDRAMASEGWRSLGRGSTPRERERFLDSLQVTTDRENPEWIYVKFTDPDRRATKIAVEEIIESYAEIWGKEEMIITPGLIADLNRLKAAHEHEIKVVRSRMETLSKKWNTSDLTSLQNSRSKDLEQIARAAENLEAQIRQAEIDMAARGENPEAEVQEQDPMALAFEIAKVERGVAALVDRYTILAGELRSLRAQGFTDRHPTVRRLSGDVEAARGQVEDAVIGFLAKGGAVLPGAAMVMGAISPQQFEAMKQTLVLQKADLQRMQEQMGFLISDRFEMESLQKELKKKEDDLAYVDKRLYTIDVEAESTETMSNRIKIISKGEEPTAPWSDSRKKLAAMGLVFGGGLPVALVMILGLLDGRFRFSDEATDPKRHVTLLGILPYLPQQMHDPEQASIAAHCVHQIRTLLQIGSHMHDRSVFAVTSPTAGDGKTSLSLSLGLSFAATGAETCLIDFDMIGGGLTSGMQAKSPSGLMDAIDAGTIDDAVRPTSFPHLSIIPAGADDARHVSRLSPTSVRRIIEQAKARYDIVVIDTGPILGSIEASLACSASDGVILALGRGQQRSQADRAIEHLQAIGAHLMGIVFNRAQAGDFRRSVSSASVRSVPALSHGRGNGQASRLRALPGAMGPMASTVASGMDTDEDPKEAHA